MPSILASEIASQSETVARLIEREAAHVARIVAQLPPFTYVVIAARGSSDHAALYATYSWGALAHFPVALAAPSLYTLYESPPTLAGALVVGISQSGQSPDIVAVLAEAQRQGRPTIAITNDGASPLARAADSVIELHAGPERSVAATKTYTAELTVIALLAAAWSVDPARLAEVQRLPVALEATVAACAGIAQDAMRYRDVEALSVVGRGYNYATAFELALKLKELTYTMAIPYSSADFRHGPIATVGAGAPVVLILPSGRTLSDMVELVGELRRRDAHLLVISDVADALALAHTPLPIAVTVPEWISPIVAIVPGQHLALHLALAREIDPDLPRGLAKVTQTR